MEVYQNGFDIILKVNQTAFHKQNYNTCHVTNLINTKKWIKTLIHQYLPLSD